MAKKQKPQKRSRSKELAALPPRTAYFDKKTKTQYGGAQKTNETPTHVSYSWTEDRGGKNIKVKTREYAKDHAKPMFENEWVAINGSLCKINKEKFDPNYENIFGKREQGAATGKFQKFKKKYK